MSEQENQEAPKEQPEEKDKCDEPKDYTLDIMKGGKLRKTLVREIIIEWEEKQEKVVIKKLTYGERAEYAEKYLNIRVHGQLQDVNVSLAQMQMQAIMMATHSAPFPITLDYIKHELDGEAGENIYKAIEDFNKLGSSTKKKSDGPSNMDQKTPESTESSTISE